MGRVDGKVALISGGARGLGASHARALVVEGARVVVCDVLDGDDIAAELGEHCRAVHLDVTSRDDWDAAVAVAEEAFGGLDARVNVSSTAGLQGYASIPGYVASQWAVRGFSKAVALDLAQYGVRCNSIHPGAYETPMTAGLPAAAPHVAMHRRGDPPEASALVVFLASDESSFSTGSELVTDGGETAGLAAPPQ